jgi:ComF family protein
MRWHVLFQSCVDLIYPPRCVVVGCGRRGVWLCSTCLSVISPLPVPCCVVCGDGLDALECSDPRRPSGVCRACLRDPPPFRRSVSAGVYEGPLRDAIHALKFRGVAAVAPLLGGLAAAAYREAGTGTELGDPVPDGAICVMPVPAHPRRTAARGVDHTRRLAEAVAAGLGCPLEAHALIRARNTRPQVGLAPDDRRRNVDGAFEVRRCVPGATVILVDDVMTTGATTRACAQALVAAGVRAVDVCTVARAVSGAGRAMPSQATVLPRRD